MYSQETIDGDISNAFKKSMKVSDGPRCRYAPSTGQPCTNGCGDTDGENSSRTDDEKVSEENGTNTNAAIKEPLFPIELKRRAKEENGLVTLAFQGETR